MYYDINSTYPQIKHHLPSKIRVCIWMNYFIILAQCKIIVTVMLLLIIFIILFTVILSSLCLRLPLPPGAFSGLWKNQEAFKHLYFEKFPVRVLIVFQNCVCFYLLPSHWSNLLLASKIKQNSLNLNIPVLRSQR